LSAVLNAVATSGTPPSTVPGTTVYTTSTGAVVTSTTVLDAGTYSLTATFTPANPSDYTSATVTNYSLTVLPDPTATAIAANPENATAGQTVTLTATVTDTYTSAKGQIVSFFDGSAVIGTATVAANGVATYTITTFSLGSHMIQACLVQTLDYLPSCSALAPENISPAPTPTSTTTILQSDINPSVLGQTVTFTAVVASTNPFNVVPTGTVTFSDGSAVLGTGTLTAGTATFATSALTVGTHNITVAYAGTTTISGSTSTILPQVVLAAEASALPGFQMTVTPTTFQVGAGSTFVIAVSVLEFSNFNLPITLTCDGLPAEATCQVIGSIPAGGGATNVIVTVPSPHTCNTNTQYFQASNSPRMTRGLPILALVTFVFFARRRRALKGIVLALLLCVIPSISGCGNCTDLGVKPGVYNFKLTGSATTTGALPVVAPIDTVSGSTVSQSQAMNMTVKI
jgi:hypothetical protein